MVYVDTKECCGSSAFGYGFQLFSTNGAIFLRADRRNSVLDTLPVVLARAKLRLKVLDQAQEARFQTNLRTPV